MVDSDSESGRDSQKEYGRRGQKKNDFNNSIIQ